MGNMEAVQAAPNDGIRPQAGAAVTPKKPSAAQTMKRRMQRNALLRAAIQAVFFVMMPGAFMAAFSGVKSVFSAISDGSVLQLGSFVKAL